jgi:EpsI family protein
MLARALVLAALFVGTGALVQVASTREVAPPRTSLHELPRTIDGWKGIDAAPLADDILATLGVDDYINRHYEGGSVPVSVYVGYYANQRSGDAIHSPRNCLPGSGWQPVSSGITRIDTAAGPAEVARYEIAKGTQRQMVLYWYEGRGRIVSGEYANKAWLMLDAVRSGRSDGGLVRIIGPVIESSDATLREVSSFAAALLPHLSRYLP